MEKISKHQLFCLVMMGQIGSTNLWALGIEAKQDAWIVILISLLIGLGLVWLFTRLQSKLPAENIAEITQTAIGKVLGWPLGFLYFLMFTFNCTRNTSEFADLINMTFLQETPRTIIMIIFMAAMTYVLFLGIETFARVTEIILPLMVILIILIYLMVLVSGRMDFKELTPVLGNGIKPVLAAVYPVGINFPFGLAFLFFQLWPYCLGLPGKEIRRTTLLAVFLSGLILTITLIIIITTLGTNIAANATIPLLEVIKLINIGEFITNIDAVGVLMIFIGGFYLGILNFFSAVLVFAKLFKINNYKWVLIPLAIFILWYAGVYEPNYPFHVKFLIPQYWQQFVPLFNIVIILLFVTLLLKQYCGASTKVKKGSHYKGGK